MDLIREFNRRRLNLARLRALSESGIVEAPKDNKNYARKNGAWVEVVAGGESGGLTQAQILARSLGC